MKRTTNRLAVLVGGVVAVSGCATGNTRNDGYDGVGHDAGPVVADAGAEDAGPSTLYAIVDGAAAPAAFDPPTAASYKAGYTVVDGTAVLPALPDYTLPTVAELTLRFPSTTGSVSCDTTGTTEVEYDVSPDSNANLMQTGTTTDGYGTCAITVTAFGPVGGRIMGTFSARLVTGQLAEGAFDVEHAPEQ